MCCRKIIKFSEVSANEKSGAIKRKSPENIMFSRLLDVGADDGI